MEIPALRKLGDPGGVEQGNIRCRPLGDRVHQPLAKLGLTDHLKAKPDLLARMLVIPDAHRLLNWPAPALLGNRDADVFSRRNAPRRGQIRRDKGAPTRLPHKQSLVDQTAQRLADRRTADPKLLAQLHFRREPLPRTKRSTRNQPGNRLLDLTRNWDWTDPAYPHPGHPALTRDVASRSRRALHSVSERIVHFEHPNWKYLCA